MRRPIGCHAQRGLQVLGFNMLNCCEILDNGIGGLSLASIINPLFSRLLLAF
jgi:hypothetical protein